MKIINFLFALTFLFTNFLSAEEKGQSIIVLDASGSMWGQIKGKAKITIAKEVVFDLLKDWDTNIDLGLTAYGHRSKGDCNDIESVVPLGPVDYNSIKKIIDNINPKGMTPLSKAVINAANELKYKETKATVILISDGIETCDYNPCDVAKNLEVAGIDFTAHVIGFDINDKEAKAQLECLAKNTGGKFLSANDAESLKASISEAVQEVSLSLKHNIELLAVYEQGGEPLDNVSWTVQDSAGKTVAYGRGSQPKYLLTPGKYIAKVKSLGGKAESAAEIEIKDQEILKKEVVIEVEGIVKLLAVNETGSTPLDNVAWTVNTISDDFNKAKTIAYGGGATPEYKLLPGKYLAKVKSLGGKAETSQEIEVLAGKKTTIEIVLAEEGIVKLVAVNKTGAAPLDNVAWSIDTISDDFNKAKTIAYGGGASPEYKILPGKYLAKVKSLGGKAETSQEIEVLAGKKTNIEIVLAEEGIVKLVAVTKEGGQAIEGVRWKINSYVEKDSIDKPKIITYGKGAQPEYRLLPGKYTAIADSIKGIATIEKVFEIVPGKKTRIEVLFPEEGEVKPILEINGEIITAKDYWEVYEILPADSLNKPKLLKYGSARNNFRLTVGKYLLKAKFQQKTYEREIEIIAGKIIEAKIQVKQ